MESVIVLIGSLLILFSVLVVNRELGRKGGMLLLLVYTGYIIRTVATA